MIIRGQSRCTHYGPISTHLSTAFVVEIEWRQRCRDVLGHDLVASVRKTTFEDGQSN